ncbi:hypothetical protein V8F33_012242 [Rhypophila sp. PSN 637]
MYFRQSSRSSLLWITGFSIASLVANLIVLLGCISPSAKSLALYRINVASLAAEMVTQKRRKDPHNVSDLVDGSLPTWWYWGMSGICDVDEISGETRCHGAFPSTKTLLAVVEDSLRRGDQAVPLPAGSSIVLSSWTFATNNLSSSVLATKQSSFVWQGRASAYLVIIAIIIDFFCPLFAWLLTSSSPRIHPYSLPLFGGLIALGAGTFAILSMDNGPHGVESNGEYGAPGIIILFVNGALRLVSSALGSKLFPPKTPPTQQWELPNYHRTHQNAEIGYRGEHYLHTILKGYIPDWSYDNWTSRLRSMRGDYPPFEQNEWNYSDFTYKGRGDLSRMLAFLRDYAGLDTSRWSADTKFRLEVKTTPGDLGRIFYVSPNQLRMMRQYNGDPRNAYVLARVYYNTQRGQPWSQDSDPKVEFFANPATHPRIDFAAAPNANGDIEGRVHD